MFPKLDPSKRHDIHIYISAHHSNPNGDPRTQNAPRVNPIDGLGLITAVSIKRKVRDYLQEAYAGESGMEIFIRHGEAMNTVANAALTKAGLQVSDAVSFSADELATLLDHDLPDNFKADGETLTYDGTLKAAHKKKLLAKLEDAGVDEDLRHKLSTMMEAKLEKADMKELQSKALPIMNTNFIDVRLFGFTAPGSAGKNRGPVQISDAQSFAPININETTLTRVARAQSSDKDGNGNFGSKSTVDHALYHATAFHNPVLARQTGVTDTDLQRLLEGLYHGQTQARSSARPNVNVEGLVIFTHDSTYGNARPDQLSRLVKIDHDEQYHNVQISIADQLPEGVSVQIIQ